MWCEALFPGDTIQISEVLGSCQDLEFQTKIMTSEIQCFDVPWSCKVFRNDLDVSKMFPGSPGHDVPKSDV